MISRRNVFNVNLGNDEYIIVGIVINCKAITDTEIKFECKGNCKECEHCEVDMRDTRDIVYPISDLPKITKQFSDAIDDLTSGLVFLYKFCEEHQDMYFKFIEIRKMLDEYKVLNYMESDLESTENYIYIIHRLDTLTQRYINKQLGLVTEYSYLNYGYEPQYSILVSDIDKLYNHVKEKLENLMEERENNNEYNNSKSI